MTDDNHAVFGDFVQRDPVQFPVPSGEIHYVLLVGASAVKPAAFTQDAYKLGRAGGGNPAAIR